MTPAKYVTEIVLPTVAEFRDARQSRRCAYLACLTTFHIKDHLAKAGEKDAEAIMLAADRAAYEIVQAVCNASKHVGPARRGLKFRVGEDWERPPARTGKMQCGVSRIGDKTGGREIGAGENRTDLYLAVRSTLFAFKDAFPAHLGPCNLCGF